MHQDLVLIFENVVAFSLHEEFVHPTHLTSLGGETKFDGRIVCFPCLLVSGSAWFESLKKELDIHYQGAVHYRLSTNFAILDIVTAETPKAWWIHRPAAIVDTPVPDWARDSIKADSSQLQEVARQLRRLYATSPKNVDALAEWNANARKFSEEVTIPLPAEVRHYLNDADIRIKDPVYRKQQDEMTAHIISSLDGGRIPPSRYVTFSFRSGWLWTIVLSFFMLIIAVTLL